MNKALYVRDGGDGSAIVVLCESMKLAEYLDENQEQGWGESSVMDLESMEVETKESVFYQMLEDDDENIKDFYNQLKPSLELNNFRFIDKYAHFNLGTSPIKVFNYLDKVTEQGTKQLLDEFKSSLNE